MSIRNTITSVLVAFIFLFSNSMYLLTGSPSAFAQQTEEVQKRGKKLAARQLIVAEIEQLQDRGVESKTLINKILEKPVEHKDRPQSERILLAWAQSQFRTNLEAQLPKISSQINKEKEWVSQIELREMLVILKPDETIRRVLSQKFPSAYQEARNSAVEIQYKRIRTGIYPQPVEIEAINKMGDKQRAQIEANIQQNMIGKLILLRENEERIQREVRTIIDDALYQLKKQREVLSSANVEGISNTAIERNLRQAIWNFIAEQKNQQKDGRKVYDIFPSASKEIPSIAQRLMVKRFQDFLSDNLPRFLDEKKIKQLITTNTPAHVDLDTSLKILDKQLKPLAKSRVVSEYAAKAQKEEGDATFQKKLEQLLKEEQNIRLVYEDQFDKTLRNLALKVREEVAKEQLASFFPEINSGEWIPPEKKIRQFSSPGPEGVDVDDLFNNSHILLQETKEKWRNAVKILLREGSTAYNGQMGLVDRHRESIKKQILEDSEGLNSDHWVNHYIDTVQGDWNKECVQLVQWARSPLRDKYSSLFDGIKETIEGIIARIFKDQEMARKEAKSKSLPSPITVVKPGGTTGGGTEGGTGGGSGGGNGDGTGGGSGSTTLDTLIRCLLRLPWWLLLILGILGLILLLNIAYIIWRIIRRIKRKKKGIILTVLKDGFRICGEYHRGKTDMGKTRATLEKALSLL